MRQPKILTTLRHYSWPLFASDTLAGITVAMVALPLSLAIAIASGATPAQGLVTAIIGGFFISLLGGSRVQIGGPTGAFIVVVFGVISQHGYDGLVLATLMAGVLLLVAGFFRAGSLMTYVPEAVVNGFTIGIGVIIATSQIKDFFGLSIENVPADFTEKLGALWSVKESLNSSAVIVALVTMALIVAARKFAPKFPGLIVAIAIGSGVVFLANMSVDTIGSRFGELPRQLPLPHIPVITGAKMIELLPSAIVIAFLAGVESLLSAMVADRMIDGHHRPNAEVTAQGFGNIMSALFGGMPVTGAIARTATNINAGGKTPVAGMVHAGVILLVMMIAAPLAGYLAMPAMAALLMVVAWNMSEPHKWRSYLSESLANKALLVITLVLTVLVDLTVAIGVGVVLGLILKFYTRRSQEKRWSVPKR